MAVFARAPVPGRAKTRLAPALGASGAAALQSAFINDTIRKAGSPSLQAERYLFLDGRSGSIRAPSSWHRAYQRGRTLGERLARAFERLCARHDRVIIFGTDSPELSPRILRQALRELATADAVLGPCPDGGFYLIGLRRLRRVKPKHLFAAIRWGTSDAFHDLKRNLLGSELITAVLESIPDIDRPRDIRQLRRRLSNSSSVRGLAPATWRFLENLGLPLVIREGRSQKKRRAISNAAARFRTRRFL